MVFANILKYANMKRIRSIFAKTSSKVNKKVVNMAHPTYPLHVPYFNLAALLNARYVLLILCLSQGVWIISIQHLSREGLTAA